MQNVKIGMVGDLLNGRTVHSLAYMLSMFEGVKMYFVAPKVRVKFTVCANFTVRLLGEVFYGGYKILQ
jgi:aspartate carbamoyltransferase catalytic subunit